MSPPSTVSQPAARVRASVLPWGCLHPSSDLGGRVGRKAGGSSRVLRGAMVGAQPERPVDGRRSRRRAPFAPGGVERLPDRGLPVHHRTWASAQQPGDDPDPDQRTRDGRCDRTPEYQRCELPLYFNG